MSDRVAADPAGTPGARITADVVVQVVGRCINAALGVVATLVIARGLGSAAFGEWMTIFAVVQIGAFLTDFGLEGAAMRLATQDRLRESEWLGAAAALRFALTFPTAAVCGIALAALATDGEMRVAALIVTATLLLGPPGVVANVVFGLRVRNDVLVATVTFNSLLWALLVILLAPRTGDLVLLALAFLAVGALTALVQTALVLRRTPVQWPGTRALRRDLRRLSLPIGLASVLTFAYGRIDQLLVFELAGPRDAGLYGAAYRIFTQTALVPTALMTTLFPILIAARHDPTRLRRAAQDAADYVLMFALPVVVFVLVEADPVIRALFGEQFAGAAPALRILIAALLPVSLGYTAGVIAYAVGEQWRLVRYAVTGLVINLAANFVLIPPLGFVAAAYVTIITEFIVASLIVRFVICRLALRPRVARTGRSAVSALALGVVLVSLDYASAPLVLAGLSTVSLYPLFLIASGAVRRRGTWAL